MSSVGRSPKSKVPTDRGSGKVRRIRPASIRTVRAADILDAVHDAVISTDMDGFVRSWNRGAEQIYGYSAAEAIGQTVDFIHFPEDLPILRRDVRQPTLDRGVHDVVLRSRAKGGKEIFVEVRASVRHDEHGKPVGFVGCSNEITARLRAENILVAQQEELQLILDAVPAYIWYKDRHNRILRANQAAAASVGLTPADLEGRSTYDLYPDEADKYHRDDQQVIESGQPKLGIVEPLLSASGEKRWIRTDKVPYRDSSGEIIGVIVFAVDITERVQAEDALREARDSLEVRVEERTRQLSSAVEQLRAEMHERQSTEERLRQQQSLLAHLLRLRTVEGMTAQLAHEINQPLAAIANFAGGLTRFLQKVPVNVDSARLVSEQIRQQAIRAGEVVRHLRNFVRRVEPQRVLAEIATVVREAVELVEADAHHRGVVVRLSVDSPLPGVHVDPIQIEQVVVNLLSNSLDAMLPDTGRLREVVVHVERHAGGGVQVQVRDTGSGLPPHGEGKLFEPYFTTKTDGLGMGLWISQSVIKAHGGEMWAENNPQGGAVVGFSLPGAAAQTSDTAPD